MAADIVLGDDSDFGDFCCPNKCSLWIGLSNFRLDCGGFDVFVVQNCFAAMVWTCAAIASHSAFDHARGNYRNNFWTRCEMDCARPTWFADNWDVFAR
jgi:hypothetical protein